MTLTQTTLFATVPVWTDHSSTKGKLDKHLVHSSGWQIRHCGHPTANYPYELITPEGYSPIGSHIGRGFKGLKWCKQIVERLARYELELFIIPGEIMGRACVFGLSPSEELINPTMPEGAVPFKKGTA